MDFRSESGQNQVQIGSESGLGRGGRAQRGRSGDEGSVAPRKVLTKLTKISGSRPFWPYLGPATTQNLVVKFDGEICAVEFWWKMLLTIFPSKRSSKISFQTSLEVRRQFRRKLCQLHSGNRWCLHIFLAITRKKRIAHVHLPLLIARKIWPRRPGPTTV